MTYKKILAVVFIVSFIFCGFTDKKDIGKGKIKTAHEINFYLNGLDSAFSGDYEKTKENMSKALERNKNLTFAQIMIRVINDLENKKISREMADHLMKGIGLRHMFLLDTAIYEYNKAIKLDKNYMIPYFLNADVYFIKNDFNKALTYYNSAVSMEPDHAFLYNNRGFAYYKTGKNDKAMNDYNKAIELQKDFPFAYENRGKIYKDTNKIEPALSDFSKAIEYDNDYADAYFLRAQVYEGIKDYKKAMKDYNKSVELKSENAIYYYYQAGCLEKIGEMEKAIAGYKKSVELGKKGMPHIEKAKNKIKELEKK